MSKKSVWQEAGRGGQPCVEIRFGEASARVYLQGAHLDSYMPDGKTELLWVSEVAVYAPGKSIRGGIPVCWPWFGAYMGNTPAPRPQHGFARISDFELIASEANETATKIVLQRVPETVFPEWQGCADLKVEISLSDHLEIKLITTNTSDRSIKVGAALHTYFRVNDVTRIQLPDVQGLNYRDKLSDFAVSKQIEPLVIDREVDRVYLDPPGKVDLIDPLASRNVEIKSSGNTDLVIWNPWQDSAKAMADFDDQGYKNMLCIEPAHALDNRQTLKPNECLILSKSIKAKTV